MAAHEDDPTSRGLFLRVVDLLNPTRKSSRSSTRGRNASTVSALINEKSGANDAGQNGTGNERDPEDPQESVEWEVRADNLDRRRWARTLPPWIHSLEDGENQDIVDPNAYLLPRSPSASRAPHHNHMPVQKAPPRRPRHGDLAGFRDGVAEIDHNRASRWAAYARASAAPHSDGEIVSEEWLKQNMPDFERSWTPVLPSEDPNRDQRFWLVNPAKRKATIAHLNRVMLRNPFVPLLVRLQVMTFCVASLALGVMIYQQSHTLNNSPAARAGTTATPDSQDDYICQQQTSTYMAFVINIVAVLYLFYIMWDEYFSKPLGLRRTRSKMRLLFLDLFFIVFSAADLSLAFNTLTDQQWSCFEGTTSNNNNAEAARSTCVYSSSLCNRQRGLVSVLLLGEITWITTFTISVLRVVERISS